MEKKSIGTFLAALRKANGMTQQDVADRLNVSNKAVSRWERNECAPDLSLIPALAEMFGVTCDELLKGERISTMHVTEKKEIKAEKQVKALITQTLSQFKTWIFISLALAIIGLICMFGISYGFYRPVIGFAVMLLFEACAAVLAVLAVSRTKDVKTDNELFEMADNALVSKFNHTFGTLSFSAFYVIFAVILLSLPLILISSDYVNSVIPLYTYFTVFFGGIVLILALVYLKCKTRYIQRITGEVIDEAVHPQTVLPVSKSRKAMNIIQIVLTVLAGVLFVAAPYLDYKPNETTFLYTFTILIGLGCLLGNIGCFVVFLVKSKMGRKELLLPGIRNIFFIPSALIVSNMHSMGWTHLLPNENEWTADSLTRYDIWETEYLWHTLALAGIVIIVFSVIAYFQERLRKC